MSRYKQFDNKKKNNDSNNNYYAWFIQAIICSSQTEVLADNSIITNLNLNVKI